ncbi:RPM1 interacting protein 13-like [Wolffia australiana]
MGQDPVIVEISSDEEEEIVHKSGSNSLHYDPSIDWLADMLDLDHDPWISRDLDVADQLSSAAPAVKVSKHESNEEKYQSGCDSDDDCEILDGDPDKSLKPVKQEAVCSDELMVVGETGQVACRDFPHSRHLCAIFPFKTSPSKFCKMCHCYVCDVPVPCANWSVHCHSTDKEERWVSERKHLRRLRQPLPNLPVAGMLPCPSNISAAHVRAESARVHSHVSVRFNPGPVAPPPFRLSAEANPYYPSYQSPLGLPAPPLIRPFHKQQTLQQCLTSCFPTKRPRTALNNQHVYHRRRPSVPPQPVRAPEDWSSSGAPAAEAAPPVVMRNIRPYAPQPTKPRTVQARAGLVTSAGRASQRSGTKDSGFPEQTGRGERDAKS